MNILMVHNYYQQRGGEDVSTESEIAMLRGAGHDVEVFSLHNDAIENMSPLRVAMKTIWNRDSYSAVRSILESKPFDIVHVQNTFPLVSPSIYYAATRGGVPVVQSVRNFRLFCLNGFFHDGSNVCERCFKKKLSLPGIFRRCYRGSLLGSITVALLKFVHGTVLKTWETKVNGYIALSDFVRKKLIEGGFDSSRIYVKPNFVLSPPTPIAYEEKIRTLVFVGRLSPEKGVNTMLEAFQMLNEPSLELLVIGDGPMMKQLQARGDAGVRFLGHQPPDEVLARIAESIALIFPSEWYETFGRVAIEAYASGTPVIGSDIGAISELIHEGVSGFSFEPGNKDSLYKAMLKVLAFDSKAVSEQCREIYESEYTSSRNLKLLTDIYEKVIGRVSQTK